MSEELKRKFKQKRMAAMPKIGKEIADYCAEHDIKNVVFLDRSARPAYQVFKKTWGATQDKKRPDIYFLSPKLMKEHGVGDQEIKKFQEQHPYLNKAKDKGTLVFDVCVKEGGTLINTYDLLEQAGFKNVHSMVTGIHQDVDHYFTPDKTLFDDHSLGCHLFGAFFNKEVGVERNGYSFLSKRAQGQAATVRKNRKELSDAVSMFYQ